MKLPHFRVVRDGPVVRKIEWCAAGDEGAFALELTQTKITSLTADTGAPGYLPTVTVTFIARLVDEESIEA